MRATKVVFAAIYFFALLFCVFALAGCNAPPLSPTTVVITNTQTQNSAPTTQPNATTGGNAVVAVRVGLFGGHCPDGTPVRGGATELKQGCIGFATATPLGAHNEKLEPSVHGDDCTWSGDTSGVIVFEPVENPFNRDIVALKPGTARISATVKGVTGSFEVVVK